MSTQEPKITRLLLAVDFDDTAEAALANAAYWARHVDATVTMLHVSTPGEAERPQLGEPREELRALAERVGGAVLARADVRLASGAPGAKIAETADEMDADLIVMGSHRRGPVGRWVVGSVAADVLRRTVRPMLLVKAAKSAQNSTSIVAAVDFSDATEAVVRHAARLAHHTQSPLALLHALPIGDHASPGHQVMRDTATQHLKRITEQWTPAGLSTRLHVEMHASPPAKVIVNYADAEHASVIVMGGHGASGWKGGSLGNVTHDVLHHTTLPVLVVRPGLS